MFKVLCDACQERPATVFVTRIVHNQATKQQLCEVCARQRASGEGWMQHLTGVMGGMGTLEEVLQGAGGAGPLDEIVMKLFDSGDAPADEETASDMPAAMISFEIGEFPADEDAVDAMEDEDDGPPASLGLDDLEDSDELRDDDEGEYEKATRPVPEVRCPKCTTTWDRLRQDGRAGCAHCYSFFAEQLAEVMAKVQRSAEHMGKQPRAAAKRRRRLEHLRTRRDHRLDMLNERLKQAVAASRYEDAAKLRDKIRIITSTIVNEEP